MQGVSKTVFQVEEGGADRFKCGKQYGLCCPNDIIVVGLYWIYRLGT